MKYPLKVIDIGNPAANSLCRYPEKPIAVADDSGMIVCLINDVEDGRAFADCIVRAANRWLRGYDDSVV